MPLKAQLMEDMKAAMRAHDSVKLNAIRFLNADIKNYEIDNGEQDDDGVIKLIQKQIKQMKDVITDYEKGDRSDLVEAEKEKIAVLERYLPQQLSDEEVNAIIDKVLADQPGQNMGIVIGQVMKQVQGKADGGRVSGLVRAKLGS